MSPRVGTRSGRSSGETARDRGVPGEGEDHRGLSRERLHGEGERRAHPRPAAAARTRSPTTRRRPTAGSRASTPTITSTSCYVVPANKKKVVTELKQALKGADELILATDEDREGEAIGWHVLEVLKPRVPVKRMVFHEITPHAIREALDASPRARHEARRGAGGPAHARPPRRLGDVAGAVARVRARAGRVGRTRAERRGAPRRRARAGAHALPLRPVARPRRHVRRATTQPFRASLVELDGKRVAEGRDFDAEHRRDRRGARRTTSCCSTPTRAQALRRPAARRRRTASRAPSPIRSPSGRGRRSPRRRCSRSRAASCASPRRARWPSRSGSTSVGYITYMRTDSTNLSEQAISAARTAIREQYGEEYLPAEPRTLPQQGEERAGGARGDPPRRRSHPHARRGARRARRRRAPSLRADLDPHGRVPDGRRTRPQDDDPARRDVDAGRAARCSARRARRTTSSAGGARTSKTSTRATRSSRRRALPAVVEGDGRDVHASSRRSATRPSRRRATPRRAS